MKTTTQRTRICDAREERATLAVTRTAIAAMLGPRMRGRPGRWEPSADAWTWLAVKLCLTTPEAIRRAWREGATHATLTRWAVVVDLSPEWLPPDYPVDETRAGCGDLSGADWYEAFGWSQDW